MQTFFDIFAELNAKTFQFEKINKFINARGEPEEEEEEAPEGEAPLPDVKKKKKKKEKKKKNQEKPIVFGDILKPTFSEDGEFLGC